MKQTYLILPAVIYLLHASLAFAANAGCYGTPSFHGSLGSSEIAVLLYIEKIYGKFYKAKVNHVYAGCGLERHDIIFFESPQPIHPHAKYVIFGSSLSKGHVDGYAHGQIILDLDECALQTKYAQLSWRDRWRIGRLRPGDCSSFKFEEQQPTFRGKTDPTGLSPNPQCYIEDCGVPPYGSSSFPCPDDETIGGFTGNCIQNPANYKCEWEFKACPRCEHGCRSDQICLDTGFCAPAECRGSLDCAYDEVCQNGICTLCDCGPPEQADFLCHDLLGRGGVPLECFRAPNEQCVWDYSECAQCQSDNDCHLLDPGVCVNGKCESAQCLTDEGCAYDEICEHYQCVPCKCGQPARGVTQCSDGSIAGPELCLNENGRCQWTYSDCPVCGVDFRCPNGLVCVDGDCVQAGVGCSNSYQCPYDTPYCLNGICYESGCRSNKDCRYDEVCGRNGHCQLPKSGYY